MTFAVKCLDLITTDVNHFCRLNPHDNDLHIHGIFAFFKEILTDKHTDIQGISARKITTNTFPSESAYSQFFPFLRKDPSFKSCKGAGFLYFVFKNRMFLVPDNHKKQLFSKKVCLWC